MPSKSTSVKQHYASLNRNDAGNRKMSNFLGVLHDDKSGRNHLVSIGEDVDVIILVTNKNKEIKIIHSPINFGGTRARTDQKFACLVSIGPSATAVLLNAQHTITNCKIITPLVDEIKARSNPEEFKNLPTPTHIR